MSIGPTFEELAWLGAALVTVFALLVVFGAATADAAPPSSGAESGVNATETPLQPVDVLPYGSIEGKRTRLVAYRVNPSMTCVAVQRQSTVPGITLWFTATHNCPTRPRPTVVRLR